MIGDMLAKIREEKGMTKTELARLTDINIGHITHIEKGERNPSHKTLKSICTALDIPYQQLMCTYDKTVKEEHERYGLVNYIPYSKVLAVDNINGLIDCPSEASTSSIALKVNDNSMEPTLEKDSYVFVEFNSPLDNKDLGVFCLNDEIIIRRFIAKKSKITLKTDNRKHDDIQITPDDDFYIIGKIFV